MNEELEQQLISALDVINTWVQEGATFAVEQAPLVVTELLHWTLISNALTVVVCSVFVWMLLFARSHMAYRFKWNSSEDVFGSWSIVFLSSFVPVLIALDSIYTAIKVWVAPRLFLLEWIADKV